MILRDEKNEEILESAVIEEEVMFWNATLLSVSCIILPFVKGTSSEKERVSVLDRVMEVVSANALSAISKVVNRGRSYQS